MGDNVKQILTRPVQLADQVSKAADEAIQFRAECLELKAKTTRLAELLRQAARASNDLYERPTRRIIDDTEAVLEKAIALVDKCCTSSLLKRVFTIIPTAAFRKMSSQLENSIGDVSWLLRVSASSEDHDDIGYLGLPPIAANEPILCLIWEQIANLSSGTQEDRSDAAASLVSLARDNDRYGKLIIEEGGVGPLLKLAKEGRAEGQENAARAIGLLGRDQESVEQIMNAGVGSVFAKILKDGNMKVQAVVAWAVSELAANYPKCQDHFAQNNAIRLLVSHLAFETIAEHSKYAVASRPKLSIHSMAMASTTGRGGGDDEKQIASLLPQKMKLQMHNVVKDTMALKSQQSTSIKGRECEDPTTKAQMKAMAARALWHLSVGNVLICGSICESRALLCFAVLLEKGADDIRYNSAMAVMEITAVAEQNADLRRNAFKPTSPAAKAVVDQLLKIVIEAKSDLLAPCIRSLGHLARTFRATETRIIEPLVKLLDEREPEVMYEAVVALIKFGCTDNFLHVNHCKAIIAAGGIKHLIQLTYFGEQMVQKLALKLLSYIALHLPDSDALAQEDVLIVLQWAMKQNNIMQDPEFEELLPEAKGRLELYQSRGSRGFH
ncbi:hypothetical protein Ancab_028043 [Ancistrocladus abbreviatus]